MNTVPEKIRMGFFNCCRAETSAPTTLPIVLLQYSLPRHIPQEDDENSGTRIFLTLQKLQVCFERCSDRFVNKQPFLCFHYRYCLFQMQAPSFVSEAPHQHLLRGYQLSPLFLLQVSYIFNISGDSFIAGLNIIASGMQQLPCNPGIQARPEGHLVLW